MPDSAAAISVLLLAWDEAAPTVRTVVEAAPAMGSLLVLLPPALPTPPAAEPLQAAPTPPAAPATTLTSPPALLMPSSPRAAASAPLAPPVPAPLAPVAAASAATEPARPAVAPARLLRLVASQLPATVRSGSFRVPAAPYLGATTPPALPAPPLATAAPAPTAARLLLAAQAAPTVGLEKPTTPVAYAAAAPALQTPAPATAAAGASPAESFAGAAPSAAAEASALPGTPATLPLAEAAFAAAEIVDPNPEEELLAAGPQPPTAAIPTHSSRLSDPAPGSSFSALGPFGNRLPQLDTAPLPTPPRAARATHDDDPEDSPEERARVFAASVAAAQQYTAPDLNSQVIRYARLAVPKALAEGPYAVIYAPAWPTWLAALELRQRTLGPLVLHLPALAAGRQPADTAAGWPAELQRQALRQADVVLVETYALARRLRRELGLGPAVVRVVPTADAAAVARALRRARRRPGLA